MASPEPPDQSLSRAEIEDLLGALPPGDWERISSMARLLVVGLTDLTADDLVAEVMTDLLAGVRTWQRGVPTLVTFKMAMLSEASNARRRAANSPIDRFVIVSSGADDEPDAGAPVKHAVDVRTPEAIVDARQQVAHIEALVKGDDEAELVLTAWALGLHGVEAQEETGLDAKRYDAARQRLLRKLKPAAQARKQT